MSDSIVTAKIAHYYGERLAEHGATPRGVDWNSLEAQQVRFDQLFKIVGANDRAPSVIDYGCGYGAFTDYLLARRPRATIMGYDVSDSMIRAAQVSHPSSVESFTSERARLVAADYVVASGIFSVKMDVSTVDWETYIFSTIDDLASLALKGFAFNMLTTYSDPARMRENLYYGNPHRFFDHCRTYSRNVALLHDYEIYEFTIHVRKGEA